MATDTGWFRKWSPGNTVIGLAVALLLLIFGIFAVLVWQAYGQLIGQAETKAQSSADLVAGETRWIIGASRIALDEIDEALAGDPTSAQSKRAALDTDVGGIPASSAYAVYDATGKAVGTPPPSLPASVAGEPYFNAVKGGQDWLPSREPKDALGNPAMIIAKRLAGPQGFAGAVLLSLSGGLLANIKDPLDLGPQSTISIVRADGWVVAREPALDQPFNTADSPTFAVLSASDSGHYISASSPADGVARIVAFRHVPELDLIAFASVGLDAVLGTLWSSVWIVTLLLAPIGIALLAGSILTARLLNNGERTRRQLEAALAHNEVLFREIHHRVKNNLQTVVALMQLQPVPAEIKLEMNRRIGAMSAVHEHIYRSNRFAEVGLKDYLSTLIENLRTSYNAEAEVIERLEDLTVDTDLAMQLGLIVNEVVSNAFKHAFADGRHGVITVRLSRQGDGRGQLSIEDNGIGFDPTLRAKGIGRRLVTGLVEQIHGESSFSGDAGARFMLVFPLGG